MVKKWHFIPVLAVALVLLIVGSFLDLQIAQALYFPRNGFGIAVASVGEVVCYGGWGLIGAGLIYLSLHREWSFEKKFWSVALKYGIVVLGVALILGGMHFSANAFISVNALDIENMWYVGAPVGFVLVGGCAVLGWFLAKKADNPNLFKALLVMVLVSVVVLLLVTVVKNIMNRPRFRWLMTQPGLSDFCNWWQSGSDIKKHAISDLGASSEEFKSFPSGHTTSACFGIMVLAYLPFFNSKWWKYQTLFFYIGVAWAAIVAFSRLTMGAHFLSDVSAGAILMVGGIWLGDFIFFRKQKPFVPAETVTE